MHNWFHHGFFHMTNKYIGRDHFVCGIDAKQFTYFSVENIWSKVKFSDFPLAMMYKHIIIISNINPNYQPSPSPPPWCGGGDGGTDVDHLETWIWFLMRWWRRYLEKIKYRELLHLNLNLLWSTHYNILFL